MLYPSELREQGENYNNIFKLIIKKNSIGRNLRINNYLYVPFFKVYLISYISNEAVLLSNPGNMSDITHHMSEDIKSMCGDFRIVAKEVGLISNDFTSYAVIWVHLQALNLHPFHHINT